ncbi:MAG: UvrB/UvrC motif-containing protein [Chitinispirillia bacterium]|nr:UvrB/UvrC motif-containing protein [Chitinispirillia bacterium]
MDKKCEDCGVNPAIVHLTHIMQNQSQTFHLCEECAAKRGITLGENGDGQTEVTLEELEEEVLCPKCSLKLSMFRSVGRLGCAECYNAFEAAITKIMLQVHGSTKHKGKKYGVFKAMENRGVQNLKQLKSDLDIAVKNEQFEEAAQLRDAIYHLKQEVK